MGQYSNWRFSVCLSVCLWGTLFRIFRISTMQQPFYGTRLLACTRRPLQPHFSFFFRSYINTLIGGFPCVCLSVCGERFFAFFGFRRYINTLIGGFPCVCVCVSVCLWVTLFRIFRISTMQQPFYGTRLLACTRRPLQPHFSFFFILYINTLIGGFPSVCVCVCVRYAFSHFSDFDDATALLRYPPTRMHPPTASPC